MAVGIIVGIIMALLTIGAFAWFGFEIESVDGSGKRSLIAIILAVILLIGCVIVPFSFHTVETGQVAVVKNLGKIKTVRDAGTY